MAEIRVLVFEPAEPKSGLVTEGATAAAQHADVGAVAGGVVRKVVTMSTDVLADAIIAVAKDVGPALQKRVAEGQLKEIAVREVAIGFSIDANAHFIVGGGAEASLTISFGVT